MGNDNPIYLRPYRDYRTGSARRRAQWREARALLGCVLIIAAFTAVVVITILGWGGAL